MAGPSQADSVTIPEQPAETANWLRMLAREVNTYVLFLQTWGAMGFVVDPEVVSSLLELQSQVVAARAELGGGGESAPEGLRPRLEEIAGREEAVYRRLTEEIRRFKDESEGIFPAFKLNFDPCF